jgi:UDP-2,3-diacylglucosamine pyrophosphatase LpxH
MLIIISDIHLGDGTCGGSISASGFRLFFERIQEMAYNASWRSRGRFQPLKEIDILMLGDILDPLHSTLWLEKGTGLPGYVRPWTDCQDPAFAAMLGTITRNILQENADAIALLRRLTSEPGLRLPPSTPTGKPAPSSVKRQHIPVRLHYLVGNHDWYYHLPGPAFDAIRADITNAFGLSNPIGPFPHDLRESPALQNILADYKVYAQHGDLFDSFNCSADKGRNAASLGDAFTVEIINRFPLEVERRMKNELPPGLLESLHELVNVRPALATPLWIGSQLRQNDVGQAVQKKIKEIWDEVFTEFIALPFVRSFDKPFKADIVDAMQLAVRLSNRVSFKTIDDLVAWARKKFNPEDMTFAGHAMKEEAFLDRAARFIVYGHTHHHEIVPLDSFPGTPKPTNQMYINSGTWHTYFDLATHKPEEQKFIPYQVLTYLAFYKDDESAGRRFETWSGTFSV